jgi:protein disulfide-isomerase
MKKFLVCLLLLAAPAAFAAEAEWLTDLPTALNKAIAEHKSVLLDFTGSDWCGWCKKLKAEVFDQPEFIAYAKDNLVLVEVDFPHQKPISAAQKEANHTLAETYKIQGYPTIVLLDSASKKLGETGYKAGGPKAYIEHLQQILGTKPSADSAKAAEPDEPRRPPPAFVPIAPAKPNYYAALALKGISGAPGSRLAMINGETFAVGDTAKVRVRDTRIAVVCKEIREDSVLITADGKPCELKLGDKTPPANTAQK